MKQWLLSCWWLCYPLLSVAHVGNPIEQGLTEGFRDRMLFVGEFVKAHPTRISVPYENWQNYLTFASGVPIRVVNRIDDPKLGGVLTARPVTEIKNEASPFGVAIELDQIQWRAILNGQKPKTQERETNPYRLALAVGLMASGEGTTQSRQIALDLDVTDEEFETWLDRRPRGEDFPKSKTLEFGLRLTSDLISAGQPLGRENKTAIANLCQKYPPEWEKIFKVQLRKQFEPNFRVVRISVIREEAKTITLGWPAEIRNSVLDHMGGKQYRGGGPTPIYKWVSDGQPMIGTYARSAVKVKVWLDIDEKFYTVEKVTERVPLAAGGYLFYHLGGNTAQAESAYHSALQNYFAQAEVWRGSMANKYSRMPGITFLYAQNPLDSPEPTVSEYTSQSVIESYGYNYGVTVHYAKIPAQWLVNYTETTPEVFILRERN